MQTILRAIFPPECLACGARVDSDFALCGSCWKNTPFILGAACNLCGTPLPGHKYDNADLICNDCLDISRPWRAGRAVFEYGDVGRDLVLGLKHGDRAEIARAAGPWMARVGADILQDNPVLVPIPLHWRRLAKRRYNQAGLLAQALARETGLECHPTALQRIRATYSQDGRDRDGRFQNVADAIQAAPRQIKHIARRPIILIDDVMTSGATFSAASQACLTAGSGPIYVMALARVAKDT